MGKNKLKKFAEMKGFRCVVEAPSYEDNLTDSPLKGFWNTEFFGREAPIVLELGCGKGEYTVGMARKRPESNFIGIDIKGARMYTGAKTVEEENVANAGFLRTRIESIPSFFAEGEVDEIWLTFPDPQLKKTNKRLTSTRFLESYRKFLRPGGQINLKTDSPFLYEYTLRLARKNGLEIIENTDDLYSEPGTCMEKEIKTFYEQQWLARGKSIKLLKFRIGEGTLEEPDISDLEPDDYRAAARFNNTLKCE